LKTDIVLMFILDLKHNIRKDLSKNQITITQLSFKRIVSKENAYWSGNWHKEYEPGQ